jgi:hypothetical protein
MQPITAPLLTLLRCPTLVPVGRTAPHCPLASPVQKHHARMSAELRPLPKNRVLADCLKSFLHVSSSGNVEPTCTTPWPTLRMCRRPPAFAIVLPTASLMTDSLPNSTIGSMLPCTNGIGTGSRPSANTRRVVRLASHERSGENLHAPGWCAPAPAWHVHPQCPLPSPARSHQRCTHLSTAASLSLQDNVETHAQQPACT